MNYKYIFQICLVISLVFFIGCKKEINEEQLGNLNGVVNMINPYQLYSNTALDNVVVKLQAGNYMVEATTDSRGLYELNDIPIGTYNLIYTKDGYSTYIEYGVQVFGGIIPVKQRPITLYALSNEQITIKNIETKGSINSYYSYLDILISYEKTEDKVTKWLLLFSREDKIDLQHYELAFFYNSYGLNGSINVRGNYEQFPEMSNWYVKFYPVVNEYYYLDPITGKEVYYSANPEVYSKASFTVSEAEVF